MCFVSFFCHKFQNQINSNHLRRAEQEVTSLQEKVQYLSAQNKGLLAQLNEAKRRQAEIECKVNNMLRNANIYVHFSLVCHCWIKLCLN